MRAISVIMLVVVAAAVGMGALQMTRQRTAEREAEDWVGGNAAFGRAAVTRYGCIACHVVPGFSGTKPHVGPTLEGFAVRTFVAGVAVNRPDNVIRFIREPRSIAPQSAMPVLGVSATDARDIATFLYSLR